MLAGQGFTLETGAPTAFRTPGFPLLLSLIYRTTGDDRSRARGILALITGLTSLGVFWLCFSLTKDASIADPRFRHPVDPLIAILAGVGSVTFFRLVAEKTVKASRSL
jgi:4-amino-4-deoxy-L-arabinose transferase-like glycosyltransferase